MNKLAIDTFEITYSNDGRINNVLVDNVEIRRIIFDKLKKIKISFNPLRPFDSNIELPIDLKELVFKVFTVISKITNNSENEAVKAFLASYLFETFNI